MGVYVPLKKVVESEPRSVGLYAKQFAKLDGVVNIPFSLVITSRVFDTFVEYNSLQDLISRKPLTNGQRVSFFSEVSKAFSSARFPQRIVDELKECFELVTLDTSNLSSLTELASKSSILSIKRSTSYLDGDTVCPGIIYSKDDFIIFLELIKSCFASLFTPSSVAFRQENNISSFSTAILLSRLPDIHHCFESHYTSSSMQIKSYVGFLDISNVVEKDVFDVAVDFLKITNSNIVRQERVSVFNVEINRPQIKQYVSGSSASQSVPDTIILELGRLSKRIASLIDMTEFSLRAVSAKSSQPTIISLSLSPSTFAPVKKIEPVDDSKVVEGFDFAVTDDLSSDSSKEFVSHIKSFLGVHRKGPLSSTIDISLRALDNEVNKESVLAALKTCQEIFSKM